MNLWTIDEAGKPVLDLHPGQSKAWLSDKRFVAILAGTQSGKTSFLPFWLLREIGRCGNEGDYLAVTATYDLLKLKMLPAFLECFQQLYGIGEYRASDRVIELWGGKARIILRSAESGGGLESSTARAAVLDEAGMDSYTIATWEAVLRRLSLSRGRVLLGTTIYNLGWLKTAVYDKWRAGDTDFDVVQFDSTLNPAFPTEEYERARRTLPVWKFDMFYRGRFARPAGLVYDCFTRERHTCPRFTIPQEWRRFVGLDFGGVNTAATFFAQEPDTKRLYLYREYHEGSRTAAQHAAAILRGEPGIPWCAGGSKSEGQWRREFAVGGLPVHGPDQSSVEVGINRVYGAIANDNLVVFEDCAEWLAEVESYARKLDAMGEPTEEIDDKADYHLLDSTRYIIGRLMRPGGTVA